MGNQKKVVSVPAVMNRATRRATKKSKSPNLSEEDAALLKNAKIQSRVDAFMKDHTANIKKHGIDFYPQLDFSPYGIKPMFVMMNVPSEKGGAPTPIGSELE